MSDALNEALPFFIGKGVSPYPHQDSARVVNRFGQEKAEALLMQCHEILAALDAIQPDWNKHTLSEASEHATALVAKQYPQLNADALQALYWTYSYGYK